jgi:hypothetical protein
MRQNKLKILAIKILANVFILTVVISVFYFIGQTSRVPQAQAEAPRCQYPPKGECAVGTPTIPTWDGTTLCWAWECREGLYPPEPCCTAECGDGYISVGEDCDGANLNGKTCVDQGYDGGTLACFPQSCLFDEGACTYNATCGNNVLERGEGCDGTAGYDVARYDTNRDGVVDCRDFGFLAGDLACNVPPLPCVPLTTGCTNTTCNNNGILDPGEKCDGMDLGGATCVSLGFASGTLSCKPLQCDFDTSLCVSGGGCTSTQTSEWSVPADCQNNCCGSVNETVVSDLTVTSDGLCAGTRQPAGFLMIARDGSEIVPPAVSSEFSHWTWKCGTEICKAYKQAECADMASPIYSGVCQPDTIWESYAAYMAAMCKRQGTDANSRLSDSQKSDCLNKYGVPANTRGTDLDPSAWCEGGWQTTDTNSCSARDKELNRYWHCSGAVPPGKAPDYNSVRCGTGWAPDSTCGTSNEKRYQTYKDVPCATDRDWIDFFGLINKGDNPELCGSGSKVYLPNSSKYSMAGGDTGDFSGFDNNATKYFDWRCRYDVAGDPRKGKPVNCQALLYSDCSSGNAICGPATTKKFSAPGAGPQTGFCQMGKLGGSIAQKVSYNQATHTWSWKCLRQDETSSVDCSVTATVWCGPAGESGEIYATTQAVRDAGACGGANGELFPPDVPANQIKDKESNWEWICEDSTDYTVYAVCKARNGKCGQAGGLVVLESTFDARKGNNGFLCSDGTIPTATLAYDAKFKIDKWTWKCGVNDCSANKLSCGWAGGNSYFKATFDARTESSNYFLCSKWQGAVNMAYTDDLDSSFSNNKATWTWDCVGDLGDKVEACSAERYTCGWANKRNVQKFYDPVWLARGAWNSASSHSEFCTYDAIKDNIRAFSLSANVGPTKATWTCADPTNSAVFENCSANFTTCGTITNYKDVYSSYSSNEKPYYYKSTLENSSLGLMGVSLCVNGTWSQTITDGGTTLNWTCTDDFGFGQLKDNSSLGVCEVNKMDCGLGNNNDFIFDTLSEWRNCYSPFDKSNRCLCNNGNNSAVDKDNERNAVPRLIDVRPGLKKATWYCQDEIGLRGTNTTPGSNCSAICNNCN